MILFGHRGAAGEAPENTLTGFRYAYQIGVRAFELDVHLSADDELVVIHDATLLRTAGIDAPVRDYTVAELASLEAKARFPDWSEPAFVPTLAQVLQSFPTLEEYQIEIKRAPLESYPRICARLVDLIRSLGLTMPITISSFDPDALHAMREFAPEIPRSLIGAFDGPTWIDDARALGCKNVCIPYKTGSLDTVALAHRHGMSVTGWPANTAKEVALLQAWQVDSITTDYPSVVIPLLDGGPMQPNGNRHA
jgi:glycerophosphoryl diester phosphodiesterase